MDIQQDLSDCYAVLLAIAFHLQAWLVGVPVLAVLGDSSVDATYLGRIFLIGLFSASSVLILVWPKIFNCITIRAQPALPPERSRARVSIYNPGSKTKFLKNSDDLGVEGPTSRGDASRSSRNESQSTFKRDGTFEEKPELTRVGTSGEITTVLGSGHKSDDEMTTKP